MTSETMRLKVSATEHGMEIFDPMSRDKTDAIFECIFLFEIIWIIKKIIEVCRRDPVDIKPDLGQVIHPPLSRLDGGESTNDKKNHEHFLRVNVL